MSTAMLPLAEVVDVGALIDVVVVSLVAGVGVAAAFSLAIYGGTRYVDARREERTLTAVAMGAVAVLSMLVVAASVVGGIAAMIAD